MPLIESRFGTLPIERKHWSPDARTDIYSLGVMLFELAVEQPPTLKNMNTLKDMVSHELYRIIHKCLSVEPSKRYQSASELLMDLHKVKGSKIKMARTLFMRKLASVSCAFTILVSGVSLSGGYYIYGQENAALLDVQPEFVTVSLQQSSELAVEKLMPNGQLTLLDNERIRWSHSQDNIVRIDGNRISGMNLGETELSGRYRNKTISLNIRVVEPMDGMVDISQRYQPGRTVSLFVGTTERDHIDGTLQNAEFVSPESIAVTDDGTIYISDSGLLRRIRGNQVESIYIEPFYMMPNIVRSFGNDVYILTHEWEDFDGYYYGIIKLTGENAEVLYVADSGYTAVEDFIMSPDGIIYYIDRNVGMGITSLRTLDPNNMESNPHLIELPSGTSSLTMDGFGAVYLANPETGVIQVYQNGTLSYFAGVENDKAFIDGPAPLFFMPQVIKYADGFLYVWDFNVLRRIEVIGNMAGECITIVGEVSPEFDMGIRQKTLPAEDIILPNSMLMDFAVTYDGILITDPKRGVIWQAD
jgi:serine/threonine protein kinase